MSYDGCREIEDIFTSSTDLLISQWAGADNLRSVVSSWLQMLIRQIDEPLDLLTDYSVTDRARGVWLDYIGGRLGLERPRAATAEIDFFSFNRSSNELSVGFDQGPFWSTRGYEALVPIGDVLYRRLLRARGRSVRSFNAIPDFEAAAQEIDPGAEVTDNSDMTISVVTRNEDDMRLADEVGALPRPAGVRMILNPPGTFAFEGADPGVGFDQGIFLQ